jgi:hypothetical protein
MEERSHRWLSLSSFDQGFVSHVLGLGRVPAAKPSETMQVWSLRSSNDTGYGLSGPRLVQGHKIHVHYTVP